MINYSFTFENLECFLLIFTRMSIFMYVAPFFSTSNTPRRLKVGFALILAFLVFRFVEVREVPEYETIVGYSVIVLKEALAGLLLGVGSNFCMSIVQFAGKIADMEVGLSMVQLIDPLTREGAGFMGNIYQYALVLIMLITNFHYFFIRAIVDSFTLIPIGQAVFSSDKLLNIIVEFLGEYVSISFRICLPIVAAMLLLNAILGVMAKTAPQMNMFSVGIQIKVLAGLGILFLTIGILPNAVDYIFEEMQIMLTEVARSMQG